jgi:hypothetical protein
VRTNKTTKAIEARVDLRSTPGPEPLEQGGGREEKVEVGATCETTKKSVEADLSCCTWPPASAEVAGDEAQQIGTKKKHTRDDELRGEIGRAGEARERRREESGGVRGRRGTRKGGNAGCGGRGKGGRKGDDDGSGGGGRGAVFVRPVCCVLRDALVPLCEGPRECACFAPRLCCDVLCCDGTAVRREGMVAGGGENLVRFGITVASRAVVGLGSVAAAPSS